MPITAALVKSLGVGFDEHMMFDSYVADKCKSSFYHLRNLSRIRKYLTRETAAIVVHAFVTSKLDYCNSLLFGLPKYQIKRLQTYSMFKIQPLELFDVGLVNMNISPQL